MEARVGAWGGNIAVRIPRVVAARLDIKEGTTVSFEVKDNSFTCTPQKRKYNLDDMLERAKHQTPPELEWGDIEPLPTEWPVE